MTPQPQRLNAGRRDQILLCLFPGPLTAPDISRVTGLNLDVVSTYLAAMRGARMVIWGGRFWYLTKQGHAAVPGAK